MHPFIKIVTSIVTLFICLGTLGLSVFALTIPSIGLSVVCALLSFAFGVFVYSDFQFYFGKKDVTNK